MSVGTIRRDHIPVVVDHSKDWKNDFEPMDFNEYDCTGFPFDGSSRRTRDPLEDIAQRHPEFAQHLQGFPRRSQRTGGDQDQDEFLRRRFERPFSSGRFERFGFPFDRDDFEREPQRYYEAYPEYFENFQNQQPSTPSPNQAQSPHQQQSSTQTSPSSYQQYPPQYSQQYQPQFSQQHSQDNQHPQYQTQASQSVSQGTQTEESESPPEAQEQAPNSKPQEHKSEAGQTRGRPIQQSNTCDLAQHQPPDEALNERGQRSMSAPPENKRFTSSVNIPMGVHPENNGSPSGGAKSQAGSGSTERVIPIHVEGRDVPVLPKTFAGSTASAAQQTHHQQHPQQERVFNDSPRSPETIFGRRPEAFTQFVHREPHRFSNDWPHSFGGFPEEEFGFRRSESPSRFAGSRPQTHQQSHQQQPTNHQQQPPKQEPVPQAQVPKPQETRPTEAQPAPKPQPQKQPQTPIEQIQAIQKDVSTLLRQVEAFNGAPRDKNYLYLDEMLTRNLLKLDNVDTQGQDAIRSARKEAIKCIERTISLLEAKAAANVAPKEEKMEVEPSQEGEEKMDADGSIQAPSAMEMSPPPAGNETMEVASASQESESKSGDTRTNDSKSADDNVAKVEEEVEKKEVSTQEPQNAEGVQYEPKDEPLKVVEEESKKESTDAELKPEVKEGEKKEKKKIKKKVNKEDKEKKQS